jgi:hypothetical protein
LCPVLEVELSFLKDEFLTYGRILAKSYLKIDLSLLEALRGET